MTFPKNSFPIKECEEGAATFDCISTKNIEGDKVRVELELVISREMSESGSILWNPQFLQEAENPLKKVWEGFMNETVREGVISVRNFLAKDAQYALNMYIDGLSLREPRLFHPGSNNQVTFLYKEFT